MASEKANVFMPSRAGPLLSSGRMLGTIIVAIIVVDSGEESGKHCSSNVHPVLRLKRWWASRMDESAAEEHNVLQDQA